MGSGVGGVRKCEGPPDRAVPGKPRAEAAHPIRAGRAGLLSGQVPAPTLLSGAVQRLGAHRLSQSQGGGGTQPAGPGTHLLPEKDPTSAPPLRSEDSGGPRESVAPRQSDPPKPAPARAKVTARLRRGPLGAASAASAHRRLPSSLLPAHTRDPGGRRAETL